MTNRGLVVLGVRLFSLFIAIQALLSSLQPHARGNLPGSGVIGLASILLALLPALAVAGLLWFFVGRIADLILPTRRGYSIGSGTAVTVSDAQIIAYSAVGLYLLADSLPRVVITAWPLLTGPSHPVMPIGGVVLVAAVLRLMLGVVLFLGARGLAGAIRQLRRAPAR